MLVEIPGWVVTLISVGLSAVVSGVVGYLIKRSFDKYFQKKDREEADQKAQEAELRKFRDEQTRNQRREDLNEILSKRIDPINQKLDVLSNGTLSSLRNDILTCYYRCREKGYRGNWDYTNIHDLYDAYVDLDGNSFVEDLMNRFDSLPAKEEVVKEVPRKTSGRVRRVPGRVVAVAPVASAGPKKIENVKLPDEVKIPEVHGMDNKKDPK